VLIKYREPAWSVARLDYVRGLTFLMLFFF
jgi:hypothetical protein